MGFLVVYSVFSEALCLELLLFYEFVNLNLGLALFNTSKKVSLFIDLCIFLNILVYKT